MRFQWVLLVALFACAKPKAEAPAEPRGPVSPDTPLNLDKPDEAKVMLDLAAARSAAQQKIQIEGVAPPTVQGLGVRLHFPNDLIYDPKTGDVKSRTYPRH